MSKVWSDEMTARVANEVKRLRGARSGQWLADRTRELDFPISRTTISELENGKRRYVTVAELVVLARALDTAPAALLYPEPYGESVQVLPDLPSIARWQAIDWFSGKPGSLDDDNLWWTADERDRYLGNVAALQQVHREAAALENLSNVFAAKMKLAHVNSIPTGAEASELLDAALRLLEAVRRYIADGSRNDGG